MRLSFTSLLLLAAGALPAPAAAKAGEPLEVVYFYSPTCMECRKTSPLLDAAEKRFGDRIEVIRYNIHTADGLEQMLAYDERHGQDDASPPKVYVGRRYLHGVDAISKNLVAAIGDGLPRRSPTPTQPATTTATAPATAPATRSATAPSRRTATAPATRDSGPASTDPSRRTTTAIATHPATSPAAEETPAAGHGRIRRLFESLGPWAILINGLIDGVNPCAFATIVFLLSVVTYLGRSRREVAIVGVTFTLAVFLTYLAIGLGIKWLLEWKVMAMESGLASAFIYAVGGLAILLAAWSAYDAIRIRRTGKVPDSALGLPKGLKAAIHKVIRKGLKTRNLVVGSFLVGVIVSLLESFCTGQVYVPTIMIMLRMPEHRLAAMSYLLLYNAMFILPLAAIMVLAYLGVGSERIGQAMRKHLALTKLLLALVFAGLGAMLIAMQVYGL